MKTRRTDYNRRKTRWKAYEKFASQRQGRYLKKLTSTSGFAVLKEMYQFAGKLRGKLREDGGGAEKIKILAKVHFMFGKVI